MSVQTLSLSDRHIKLCLNQQFCSTLLEPYPDIFSKYALTKLIAENLLYPAVILHPDKVCSFILYSYLRFCTLPFVLTELIWLYHRH